ncbi:MAG: DDE-type integrase/transposase/recombinase [Planctomycetota bacterium]
MSDEKAGRHDRWAQFRFSVVGSLLAAPPKPGELRQEFEKLAAKTWRHPVTGESVKFGLSTIERWYYQARAAQDPVRMLRPRVRKDAGAQPSLSLELRSALRAQHRDHPRWSFQLHYDNLVALAREHKELGAVPSYDTVRRWMRSQGLLRVRRIAGGRDTAEAERTRERVAQVETRSFEAGHVNGLWHADFHVGSRRVLLSSGEWAQAHLLGILDDRSRLCCHLQWYLAETAENFAHGLAQAFQKRALPRAILTDNGPAMVAAEIEEGLLRLGVVHETTLAYAAWQNGKQENLWVSCEGRLMSMLEGVKDLTLALLNEATQAWAEIEHNREVHSEIGTAPLSRYLAGPDVGRPSPSSDAIRAAFRLATSRAQRRSDGTTTIEGVRFEVPSRYRNLERLFVRYARWDLSAADLVDPRTGNVLAVLYPLDKARNADGARRTLDPLPQEAADAPAQPSGIAPLLKSLMAEYAATGLPPAYLPKDEKKETAR